MNVTARKWTTAQLNRLTATVTTQPLRSGSEGEVLQFLAERPLQTIFLSGLVRDNGLVSAANRGTFYGCRDAAGQLVGVALIGHATLFEARTDGAIEAFAQLAGNCTTKHMILGEQATVQRFWSYYGQGQMPRLACRELLYELRYPVQVHEPVAGLRPATAADLALIVPVHAQLAYEESGVNPLERDPAGFRQRCLKRIEQGRVWVWVVNGALIFKADVVRETAEVTYLEGIYVNPAERGKGYGTRCVSQLGRTLLEQTRAVCLLVNEQNESAHRLYRKTGYKLRGTFDTAFL